MPKSDEQKMPAGIMVNVRRKLANTKARQRLREKRAREQKNG